MLAALERLGEEGPKERLLLSDVLDVAEELAEALRADPACERVDDRRLGSAPGRDLQGHRPDRHRDRPGGAREGARGAPAGRAGRIRRRGGRSDRDPQRDRRRPEDRRSRCLRQPASALHRLEGAQRRAARAGAQARPVGLRARDHRDRERRRRPAARARPRSTSASASPTSSPSCGRAGARSRRPRRASCRSWSSSADIRGDLHCHTTLSDGRNSLEEMAEAARGRGYGYLAMTDHSASHGFGDHVTPDALLERVAEIAELNERYKGKRFRVLAGIGGQHPHRRLARLRGRGARGARLGDRLGPHLVPDLAREDDRRGC